MGSSSGRALAPLLLLVALAPRPAAAQAAGGAGEPCETPIGCGEGLECVEGSCTAAGEPACRADGDCGEGRACRDGRCAQAEPALPASTRWADFELGGTHFFAGATFSPGLTGYWV